MICSQERPSTLGSAPIITSMNVLSMKRNQFQETPQLKCLHLDLGVDCYTFIEIITDIVKTLSLGKFQFSF